ncbi:MAG: dynamin family protein [Anaerolineae bacterium]|nr:dynamin family protein [Anaerolineae bacterium]
MALANVETKLATEYENIRRRQYELISGLLDVLPKVDNLGEDRINQTRDALFHADHPFLIVLVGPFSSGKSSILNALLGETEMLPIGPVPTTDRITILRYGDQPQRMTSGAEVDTLLYPSQLLQKVSLVDTPGLESIFQRHEEITRKFLHRSDVVLLVMLATQAMTARNLEYLQTLREYGKKVILVINQTDLLTGEEAETVREYVIEQSQTHLGFRPDVWLVSAREGLAARQHGELDKSGWKASGLSRIEEYVDDQLNDVERLRQKLQTPLQITRNVTQAALDAVRVNQAALDQYQGISANIEQQLQAQKREQEKIVREIDTEISDHFGAAAMRGSEAIRDLFRFSNALRSLWGGLLELIGLSGLLKRGGRGVVQRAFEARQAFVPFDELPRTVDKLAPRLEGKDVHDVEDLVKYARKEIDNLPDAIRSKVIGSVQPPLKYDRTLLQQVKPDLEAIETEARQVETDRLDQSRRNAMLYLAVFELLLVIFGIVLLGGGSNFLPPDQREIGLLLLIFLIGLGVLALLFMPLRGRLLESAYTNRMLKLQNKYIDTLTRSADKQIDYGLRLRRDAVLPLTRLIDAQTQIQTEQLSKLQSAMQEINSIETALASMGGKRWLPGVRGQ